MRGGGPPSKKMQILAQPGLCLFVSLMVVNVSPTELVSAFTVGHLRGPAGLKI